VAGFKAHFTTATISGGVVATSLMSAGLLDQNGLLFCFVAVALGGLLPDIDSDSSTVLTVSFTIFSLTFSFFVMFSQTASLATLELLMLWFGVFLIFKLVVFELFIRLTKHRGIFHSVPAAFLSLFFTVFLLNRLFIMPGKTIWLIGSFVFLGYVIHLLLDELTSLNLLGSGGIRHSFGTAMKLYSTNLPATTISYLATITLYTLTPDSDGLFKQLLSPQTWQTVSDGFLPSDGWFNLKLSRNYSPPNLFCQPKPSEWQSKG
jgi:hypothetical protein